MRLELSRGVPPSGLSPIDSSVLMGFDLAAGMSHPSWKWDSLPVRGKTNSLKRSAIKAPPTTMASQYVPNRRHATTRR